MERIEIEGILDAITEMFEPVGDISKATHRWTTSEIADAIKAHTGTAVSNDELYCQLKMSEFVYMIDNTVANVKFVWLLREK